MTMLNKTHKVTKIFILSLLLAGSGFLSRSVQAQDNIPVREYTNPDEVVTFDRTTPFARAVDVLNDFSQENLEKSILDRSGTGGNIGISISPMHWRDALDLILRVKGLQLRENEHFFEIYKPAPKISGKIPTGAGGEQGDTLATTSTREVRINAIFFEGNRRALREIGVDWSTLTENAPAELPDFVTSEGGQTAEQIPSTSPGFDNHFVSVNTKGAQSVSQNVFNALINFGEIGETGVRVQTLLSAFEADNLGEILASPSVKVMEGVQGRIQVGQDFSIKQRDFAGNVTDEFFSVGTILEVTPTIIEQQDTTFIHLNILAERSSAQPDPVSTIINKQESTTQALLLNGEATAIAGLYRTETAEVRRGIPILKDLPPWLFGLRYIFGFNSTDRQTRELVILIEAEIEPSIPDRYGKKHKDKFEILRDERERMRDEMDRKTKYDVDDEEEGMREDSLDTTEEDTSFVEEQPEPNGDEMNAESPEEDVQVEEMDVQEVDNNDGEQDENIVDPELNSKPVPLNLGSATEENTGNEKSEEEQPKEENDMADNEPENPVEQAENEDPGMGKQESVDSPSTGTASVNQSGSSSSRYFIIGSSFKNEDNANNYRDGLAEKGFNPVILKKEDSSYYFVAYRGYDSYEKAMTELPDIRSNQNSNAWLYVNKK